MCPRLGITRELRSRRAFGLALVYALATMAAHSAHHHEHQDVPHALMGCSDPGSHWAGHTDAPDLTPNASLCAACQQRAAVHFWLASPANAFRLATVPHVERNMVAVRVNVVAPFSSRGPPRV